MGPCMCGDPECPRCFPRSEDIRECPECEGTGEVEIPDTEENDTDEINCVGAVFRKKKECPKCEGHGYILV